VALLIYSLFVTLLIVKRLTPNTSELTVEDYNFSVRAHSDGLYRFMLKFTDAETAKDIVQDCFEKLWLKRETVDGAKAKSYLFTAGYNTMIDKKRKNRRMDYTDKLPIDSSTVLMSNPDLQQVLNNALNNLPEIQKTVVILRDYEGYNYEEIGEITGLSESQVKVYIFRARVALKNHIGSLENVLG
jgi:RNA polymerase sigma factor (sigma-70 family)